MYNSVSAYTQTLWLLTSPYIHIHICTCINFYEYTVVLQKLRRNCSWVFEQFLTFFSLQYINFLLSHHYFTPIHINQKPNKQTNKKNKQTNQQPNQKWKLSTIKKKWTKSHATIKHNAVDVPSKTYIQTPHRTALHCTCILPNHQHRLGIIQR